MTDTWTQVNIKLIMKYLKRQHNVNGDIEISVLGNCGDIDVKCSTKFGGIAFTIIKGKPWKTTQKYIDSIMQQLPIINEPKECSICCNMSIHFCSCAQCYHRTCTKCTVDIFKLNKGFIVCPYCNFKVGRRLLPEHIELVAAKMLSTTDASQPSDYTWN